MLKLKVLTDANIIFSRTLRDWVVLLATQRGFSVFDVYWTESILVEALYNLRKKHPTWNEGKVLSVREKFEKFAPDNKITDFSISNEDSREDPHDSHVLAAARHCGVDILLTQNTKDFPENDEDCFEVYNPDEFFLLIAKQHPKLIVDVISYQIDWMRKQNVTNIDLSERLESAGAPNFAACVQTFLRRMALQ